MMFRGLSRQQSRVADMVANIIQNKVPGVGVVKTPPGFGVLTTLFASRPRNLAFATLDKHDPFSLCQLAERHGDSDAIFVCTPREIMEPEVHFVPPDTETPIFLVGFGRHVDTTDLFPSDTPINMIEGINPPFNDFHAIRAVRAQANVADISYRVGAIPERVTHPRFYENRYIIPVSEPVRELYDRFVDMNSGILSSDETIARKVDGWRPLLSDMDFDKLLLLEEMGAITVDEYGLVYPLAMSHVALHHAGTRL